MMEWGHPDSWLAGTILRMVFISFGELNPAFPL